MEVKDNHKFDHQIINKINFQTFLQSKTTNNNQHK
jgi:hypothetical protein